MSATTEAVALLEKLEPPALEIVLDQTRIAYRVQEAAKAACNTTAPAPEEPEGER